MVLPAASPGRPPKDGPATGHPMAGILFLLAALVLLPIMDGCAKLLSQRLSVFEITWARYTIHWVLLLPLLLARYGWRAFKPARLGMQLARSAMLLVGTVLFFFGLAYMPVADTLALFFVSPLVATALSPWILGEKVGQRRYAAVLIGFIGALIIFRPGIGVFRWPALFPFASGFCYAFYALWTRQLAGSAAPLITAGFTALVGALATSVTAPLFWVMPTAGEAGLMLAIGLIAAIGHYLLIRAYERAPASLLAPFGYFEIIMAVVVGLVLFGDFPDLWTWVGIAVLVGSGLYISLRERKLMIQGADL
jgi:drug/metabolite transporter (DMT)-like permease